MAATTTTRGCVAMDAWHAMVVLWGDYLEDQLGLAVGADAGAFNRVVAHK